MDVLNIVILGVILSIVFFEITNISPGGIIVPGLLVAYINQPERIVYTVIVSIITYLLVKILSRYVLVYGKRKFALMIIVSVVVNLILELLIHATSFSLINVAIIGYTIPGIIANDIYKQGIVKTIPSLVIVTLILELIVIISNSIGIIRL